MYQALNISKMSKTYSQLSGETEQIEKRELRKEVKKKQIREDEIDLSLENGKSSDVDYKKKWIQGH